MGKRLTVDDYRAVTHLTRPDAAKVLGVSYAAVAIMVSRYDDLEFAPRETQTAKILKALKADPDATTAEISKRVGVAAARVSTVRHRNGLSQAISLSTDFAPDIADWVRAEAAKSKSTIGEFVNACLVDAMWEAHQ